MERNFVLAIALSFLVVTLWSMYTASNRPPPDSFPSEVVQEGFAGAQSAPAPVPGQRPAPAPREPSTAIAMPAASGPPTAEERVTVRTDLYEAEFTTRGGALLRWQLTNYDDASQPGRPRVEITTLNPASEVALATPFEELGFGDLSLAAYRVEQPTPRTLVFTLERGGTTVRKTYFLEEDSYLFRLRMEVENGPDRHAQPTFRTVWPARKRDSDDFAEYSLVARNDGSVDYASLVGGSFLGGGGGGISEVQRFAPNVDWVGADTPYFLAAILPDLPREAQARFEPTRDPELSVAAVSFQPVNLPPGQRVARELRIYLGPKEAPRLEAVGAHLDDAIAKGWFAPLTSFFVWALRATHRFVPNYGFAIILITLGVRVLMFPIMQKQVKSMKRMGEMQPKMKEIQEKYADDRERQSQEMMKLYKESGFNPLTGCLPMFLQLPVFIGLYYALRGTIQLRQEPFIGWIDDLSRPETLFMLPGLELPVRVLPLLMGGSMVLQQRLTPTTMDPAQARMMSTVMPVMFTFLFYQFASGLVLYWLVSNVLGILQQVWTNSRPDPQAAKPAVAATAANTKSS